jgi:methylisocitrate lyase
MANMTEFGKTPIIPASRFEEMGYDMVIFPMSGFRMMLKALDICYSSLMKTGTQAGLLDWMRTRKELYALIDYAEYEQSDEAWAGLAD